MSFITLAILALIFVFIAEVVRRDAISEGVDPKQAWFFGLLFGTTAVVTTFLLIWLIT